MDVDEPQNPAGVEDASAADDDEGTCKTCIECQASKLSTEVSHRATFSARPALSYGQLSIERS